MMHVSTMSHCYVKLRCHFRVFDFFFFFFSSGHIRAHTYIQRHNLSFLFRLVIAVSHLLFFRHSTNFIYLLREMPINDLRVLHYIIYVRNISVDASECVDTTVKSVCVCVRNVRNHADGKHKADNTFTQRTKWFESDATFSVVYTSPSLTGSEQLKRQTKCTLVYPLLSFLFFFFLKSKTTRQRSMPLRSRSIWNNKGKPQRHPSKQNQ